MGDVHITKEMLVAAEAGELPWWRVASYGLAHIMSACPTCEREYSDYLEELEAERAGRDELPADDSVRGSVERVAQRIFLMDRLVKSQKETAVDAARTLAEAKPEDRTALLHEMVGGKAHAPLVGEHLLSRVALLLPDDLDEANDLALLAEVAALDALLGDMSPADLAVAVLARALALQGEIARRCGRRDGAEILFSRLHDVLSNGRLVDPLALGEVSLLEARLYRDQEQMAEAEELCRMAHEHYEAAASSRGVASALTALAQILNLQERFDEADEATGTALAILTEVTGAAPGVEIEESLFEEPVTEDSLVAIAVRAHLERARAHRVRGDLRNALREVDMARLRLGHRHAPRLAIALFWMEARIARDRGDLDEAEDLLRTVRERLGDPTPDDLIHELALLSLELADLLLARERPEDARRLVWEIRPLYDDPRLSPEARKTLAQFRQEAAGDSLETDSLREALRFLERTRYAR